MAFEDVDYCLRAWERGHRVVYAPAASLTHAESKTRGTTQGPRELRSQARFWDRWGERFDRRDVHAEAGGLRIVYVTLDTGVGGGHRVIFTHLNGLAERGHEVELWTLARRGRTGSTCRSRAVFDYRGAHGRADAAGRDQGRDMVGDRRVGLRGLDPARRPGLLGPGHRVVLLPPRRRPRPGDRLYRPEFRYFAGSEWIRDELRKLVASQVPAFTPGIDLERFRSLEGVGGGMA